jgi:hypothetical protein
MDCSIGFPIFCWPGLTLQAQYLFLPLSRDIAKMLCWNPSHHRPRRNIFSHDSACGDESSFPNLYTW